MLVRFFIKSINSSSVALIVRGLFLLFFILSIIVWLSQFNQIEVWFIRISFLIFLLISSSLKFFRRTVLIFTSIFCFFASNRPSKTNFKFPPLVINWNFSGIKVSNEIFILGIYSKYSSGLRREGFRNHINWQFIRCDQFRHIKFYS